MQDFFFFKFCKHECKSGKGVAQMLAQGAELSERKEKMQYVTKFKNVL